MLLKTFSGTLIPSGDIEIAVAATTLMDSLEFLVKNTCDTRSRHCMALGTAPFVIALYGFLFDTCVGGCAVRTFSSTCIHRVTWRMSWWRLWQWRCPFCTLLPQTYHCWLCSAPAPTDHLEPCSTAAPGATAATTICGFRDITTAGDLTSLCSCTIASPRGLAPEHRRGSSTATG